MAWVTQGAIADRTKERLGASDRGLVMYRGMLKAPEMEKVARGEDPIGVLREASMTGSIEFAAREGQGHVLGRIAKITEYRRQMSHFSPIADELIEVFTGHSEQREKIPAE